MWIEALVWVLRGVLVLVCLLMLLVILMQRSKQEGIGAAFGAGMTESVFGADTGNVLSKTTVWCAVLFFGITLALSAIAANKYRAGTSSLSQAAQEAAKAMASPAAATTNAPAATTNAPAVAPATNAVAAPVNP
jgi:preprotein translocase subunit SecG